MDIQFWMEMRKSCECRPIPGSQRFEIPRIEMRHLAQKQIHRPCKQIAHVQTGKDITAVNDSFPFASQFRGIAFTAVFRGNLPDHRRGVTQMIVSMESHGKGSDRNFIRFRNRQQMKREQDIHFLTMLHASSSSPENAALAAFLITRWLLDPEQENATEMDSFFGWENENDDDRTYAVEQDIWDLVSIWRYNYKKCRNIVKADWAAYEEAYGHVIADNVVPEDLQHFADILENSEFVEDPIKFLRDMEREEIEKFVDLSAALNGMDEHDAAVFADAALTWLETPSNDGARQIMHRIGGWRAAGVSEEIAALRDFFEKSAVSWKFNYGGLRSSAVYNRKNYFMQLTEHRGENRTERSCAPSPASWRRNVFLITR